MTVIIIHKLTSLTLKLMGEFPSKLDFEARVIFALFLLNLVAFLKKLVLHLLLSIKVDRQSLKRAAQD